jgi:hypothetical protein
MNTVRWILTLGAACLAVLVLAEPAAAQDEAEADTIWVEGDKTLVIMGEDGRRVIVRSADGEDGARFFIGDGDDDWPHVFNVRPDVVGRSLRAPLARFHNYSFDDDDGNVTLWGGDGFNGIISGQLNNELLALTESSKGRSEIMKMEMESQRLAQQARRAEGAERTRLEQELEDKLTEIFDRKQALREERIERLRESMNDALEEHNNRNQARSEIVDRRLRELLGQRDKYDW